MSVCQSVCAYPADRWAGKTNWAEREGGALRWVRAGMLWPGSSALIGWVGEEAFGGMVRR